ncbi:MAG: SMP-30/gluconolactonase/LRE family protein [Deltaproteobacteria bacterium]|nr:SMP-30/gluconolactonase/LRE family protein [Deltaproteobacteria bacterium]
MIARIQKLIQQYVYGHSSQLVIPVLDGALHPNNRIDTCDVVKDSLAMPDDLVIDQNGTVYISCENKVLKSASLGEAQFDVYAEFNGITGGLSFHPDGSLMVCVSGEGVWFVNASGALEKMALSLEKPLLSPTCIAPGPDGVIYITDGSCRHILENWVRDLMEKRSDGRLIQYDPQTKKSKVLLSKLRYPHGICVNTINNSLILTESWAHQISQYPLDNIRAETRKDFMRNLPGYPSRIIPTADENYWVALFARRTQLIELILEEKQYRLEMMRQIEPPYWVAPSLKPNQSYLEPLQGGQIKQLGEMKPWAPPRSYGLVIRVDKHGEVKESLHCRSEGERHGITGLYQHLDQLYIVSKGGGCLLKVTDMVE